MLTALLHRLYAEVIVMKKEDAIWQAFRETGDPIYYLLYKASDEKKSDGDGE